MLSLIASMRSAAPVALLLSCAAAHGAQVGIDLRQDALVRGKSVLLGDVAVIDAPAEHSSRLAAMPLATAPMAGYTEILARATIESVLRSQPMFSDMSVAWRGAERVVVRRTGVRVDGASITDAARRSLQAAHASEYAQLELTPLGTAADVHVPEGVMAVRTREAGLVLRQRTTVWVDVLVDGTVVRSAMVPFQVRAWNPVLVAQRGLAAGTHIGAADFRSERRDVLALAAAPAREPASWAGLRLGTGVAEGEVLPSRAVIPAGAVRRGDRVRLVMDNAPLRVETAAVAQEDGAAGARVRVIPAGGGEAVAARVMGQGVVAIEGR